MLFHQQGGGYKWEKSAFKAVLVKLYSERWLGTFSLEDSFSLLTRLCGFISVIQLVISWAGSSNNLSYALFHPNVPFYLQQDVQALIVWSCFHWQRQKARETSTVLGLQPFKRRYNLCLYVVMSANISGCLLALAHGCCLCWPPAPAEGAVSGHKLRFLQPQGCLAEVREWSFPLCKLVNPGLNFPFSLSADKVGSAVFISLQISLKEHNGVLKNPTTKQNKKPNPKLKDKDPGINILLLCEART